MFIIKLNASGYLSRPKYWPNALHGQYSVVHTGPAPIKARHVFGPTTQAHAFMIQKRFERAEKKRANR